MINAVRAILQVGAAMSIEAFSPELNLAMSNLSTALREHQHVYADPVLTEVVSVHTFEVWGEWDEIIEHWVYLCPCGERITTSQAINRRPDP